MICYGVGSPDWQLVILWMARHLSVCSCTVYGLKRLSHQVFDSVLYTSFLLFILCSTSSMMVDVLLVLLIPCFIRFVQGLLVLFLKSCIFFKFGTRFIARWLLSFVIIFHLILEGWEVPEIHRPGHDEEQAKEKAHAKTLCALQRIFLDKYTAHLWSSVHLQDDEIHHEILEDVEQRMNYRKDVYKTLKRVLAKYRHKFDGLFLYDESDESEEGIDDENDAWTCKFNTNRK